MNAISPCADINDHPYPKYPLSYQPICISRNPQAHEDTFLHRPSHIHSMRLINVVIYPNVSRGWVAFKTFLPKFCLSRLPSTSEKVIHQEFRYVDMWHTISDSLFEFYCSMWYAIRGVIWLLVCEWDRHAIYRSLTCLERLCNVSSLIRDAW